MGDEKQYEGETPGKSPDEDPSKGEGVEPGETNVSGGDNLAEASDSSATGDGPSGGAV